MRKSIKMKDDELEAVYNYYNGRGLVDFDALPMCCSVALVRNLPYGPKTRRMVSLAKWLTLPQTASPLNIITLLLKEQRGVRQALLDEGWSDVKHWVGNTGNTLALLVYVDKAHRRR